MDMKLTNKEQEILKQAVEYVKAIKITQARVQSDTFWSTADAGDIDEIDLEETLAQIKLVSIVEEYLEHL